MTNFFSVPIIGDGSEDNPFRPDIPDGTPFVGQSNGTDYLIATPNSLSGWGKAIQHMPRPALETVCQARGLTYDEVMLWNVGGS